MKKALIIANMLFASATVFGMNPIQIGGFSTINQSENVAPMSKVKTKLRTLFETAQSQVKDNNKLSEDAKLFYSNLEFEAIWEEIERIFFSDSSSEKAKQTSDVKEILSRLEKIFGKNSSEAENLKTLLNGPKASFRQIVKGSKFEHPLRKKAIESAGKRGAKLFFKDVLGSSESGSELAKYLYKRAVYEIDSAKCIPGPNRSASLSSYNSALLGIECGYYDYDDLLLTLVHETGHGLDWAYRVREKYGQSEAETMLKDRSVWKQEELICLNDQQGEYVPMFFETLLRSSRFRGNLYPENSSAHRFRLYDSYLDLVNKNLIYELTTSYSKEQLNDLLTCSLKGDLSVISKLKKNNKMRPYMEAFQECFPILHCQYKPEPRLQDTVKKGRSQWENLLKSLDKDGYADLAKLFRDIENGESRIGEIQYKGVIKSFTFKKGSESFEKSLPKLEGIDWEKICDITTVLSLGYTITGERYDIYVNMCELLKEKGHDDLAKLFCDIYDGECTLSNHRWGREVSCFIFEKNLEKRTESLPNLDGINWSEIYDIAGAFSLSYFDKFFSFFHNHIMSANHLVQKEAENTRLDVEAHLEGKYNSFRLIKEEGYFDILERGESLPAEEFMKKLIELAGVLNLTRENAEKFFEFLKN